MTRIQLGHHLAPPTLALVFLLAVAALTTVAGQEAGVLEVGAPMPDFQLDSLDSTTLGPASVRGEAPLVVVFFRGAW